MDLVPILFSAALLINFVAAGYAFFVRSVMKGGALQKIALGAALSILVFGFHHMGELVLEGSEIIYIAEGVEIISGALLIWAMYELYQIVRI